MYCKCSCYIFLFSVHLKEEARDFLEPGTIKDLVKKYSQFINFNIYLWTSKTEEVEEPVEEDTAEEKKDDAGSEDKKEDEKDEKENEKEDEDKEKDDKDDEAEVEEESEEKEKKPKTKKVGRYLVCLKFAIVWNDNLNFLLLNVFKLT